MTSTTVHYRFEYGTSWREGAQLVGDAKGGERSLRAAQVAAMNVVTAPRNQTENYGAWVYDIMAHPGRPQLWRLCRGGRARGIFHWVVAERR